MLHRLPLAHRLLLIYLLSFVSVVVLAYSLIVEKNIAIDFARKEQRGSAYVAVVRDALLAVVEDHLKSASSAAVPGTGSDSALKAYASKILAADARFGWDMRTKPLADQLVAMLQRSDQENTDGTAAHATHYMQTVNAAKLLVAQIGDDSNLILDPDLDSYYMMSTAILRLPEFVTATAELADAATLVHAGMPSDGAWIKFYVTKGAFGAAAKALASDNARTLTVDTNESTRGILQASFAHMQGAITGFLIDLQNMLVGLESPDASPIDPHQTVRSMVGATGEYWRQVTGELDRLLALRISLLYQRMAINLAIAGLVWLVALGLILIISRQITRPIRELASVAERIHHDDDYRPRTHIRAGGEIGSLVRGFNAMLDRLQREIAGAQERVARDRAAAAEQQLLQAIPLVISVARESDGKVVYANSDPTGRSGLPSSMDNETWNLLDHMRTSDRRAFLAAFRLNGRVDGFEARCRKPDGGDCWVLVGARALTYQGEPARLDVYIPIDDLKHAEAALARRNAVLSAITYAATRIIGADDWRTVMPEFLSRLGIATGVGRVFLFEIHPTPGGELVQSFRFVWSAPDIPLIVEGGQLQNLPIPKATDSQIADWFRRRARGEVIQVTRQQTSGDGRAVFEEHGTYSMLSVPIMVNGQFWGALGFDDCQSERQWDDTEIDLLKTATALIAGAIGRANADAQLRRRDDQLIEAQRIAHVGSWELDLSNDRVTWSDEGWRIFGLEPSRLAWSHEENLAHIHADDRQRVAAADAAAKDGHAPIDMEYRVLRPDGEVRIVYERAEVLHDDAGRPVRLIGTIHDVTELKATEAKLRESDERYALAARGADVGLWDWDLTQDHVYLSPRLHEILGTIGRELGQSISGLLDQLLPEDVAALQQHLKERYAWQRRRFEFEVRTREPADEPRWLVLRGLIVYADGNPIRLVGSLRDITDRKRTEEEMARQKEALHQSEKMAMFGSLLAGVAHELNNPLSVVIGQIALLQQTSADPAVVQRAERIRNATERCARIVRTFLAMARQKHAEPQPTDVNGVVEMAVELLAYQLRSASIDVKVDLADDLPVITADPDQIHQILTNLIVNARQALSATAASRHIWIATRFDGAAQQVRISVVDNGPGIPQEMRSRIFEPFFTTKPAGEGSGIGLSLCASIVRAHGGRIDLSDSPGGGAAFTVILPLGEPEIETMEVDEDHRAPTGLRVLVIDDEPEIADTLTEILRRNGHKADTAATGKEGLERMGSNNYDVILSDIRMPSVEGCGLYDALRRLRPDAVDKIAFVTGDTLSPEIQSFLAETRVPYLEKPFLPDDVLRLLVQVVERHTVHPCKSTGKARAG